MPRLSTLEWLLICSLSAAGLATAVFAVTGRTQWALALIGLLLTIIAVAASREASYRRRSSQRTRAIVRQTREAIQRVQEDAIASHADTKGMIAALDAVTRTVTASRSATSSARKDLRSLRQALETAEAAAERHANLVTSQLRQIEAAAQAHAKLTDSVTTQTVTLTKNVSEIDAALAVVRSQVNRVERQTRNFKSEMISEMQSVLQLIERFAPQAPLPPLAGWALSPAGLFYLADTIDRRKAELVVECGSGTSTLWMALAMRRKGTGKVIALEHQAEYAKKTSELLEAHGAADWAEVRLTPLVETATPRGTQLWYDVGIDEIDQPIDILLVDGPPRTTGPHARYPAVPLLRSKLAPNCLIIADDTNRADEREMLDLWIDDWPDLEIRMSPGHGLEVLEALKNHQ